MHFYDVMLKHVIMRFSKDKLKIAYSCKKFTKIDDKNSSNCIIGYSL